jgi:hypothetical protein
MMLPRTLVILGAVLGPGPASNATDTASGLRERVDALETRIARLEATTHADLWLTRQRSAEVRELVTDILADADSRAAGLDQSLTGGWNEHFFIRSEDGSFLMEALGVVQARFMLSHQRNAPADNDRWGFEASRVRLKVMGHVVDPSWHYFVQVELAQNPGLRDAFVRKDLGGGWFIRAGQFKLPFTREKLETFTKTLAVDRSLVDRAYSVGRSAGLELDYVGSRWRQRQQRCACRECGRPVHRYGFRVRREGGDGRSRRHMETVLRASRAAGDS